MTNDEILLSLIDDKMEMCNDCYMLTNTNFLDMNQQSIAIKHLKKFNNVRYEFYGGFSDCERKILLFLPDYLENSCSFSENEDLNPIVQLKITKDGFSNLSHRDYLGSIMALGIKREMLGDLIVTENGCLTVAIKSVAQYIKDNLLSVGHGTVQVEIFSQFEDTARLQNTEEKRCYVSSMRVDSVVSAVFNISRTIAVEKIKRGEVFVNDVMCEKPDYKIDFSSKLVVRGKGKAIIKSDEGITKKGRQAFIAVIYK